MAERAAKSKVGKSLVEMVIESVPTFYRKGARKIKNQKICKALSSDLANTALNYGRAFAYNKLN